MGKIMRSTNIKGALSSKQGGFLINPFRMAPPPPIGDPSFSSVKLLLHGDGADGSTIWPDSSTANRTLTLFGNARISTLRSKFGGSSLYFDGADDYATVPTSPDFYFPGDFTLEAWVYCPTTGIKYIMGNWLSPWPFAMETTPLLLPEIGVNGGNFNSPLGPALSINTWIHMAVSRNSGTIKAYANGVQYSSQAYATAIGPAAGYSLGIGSIIAYHTSELYMDEIRVTKGVGRYPAAFTPPTAPFPNY